MKGQLPNIRSERPAERGNSPFLLGEENTRACNFDVCPRWDQTSVRYVKVTSQCVLSSSNEHLSHGLL